MPSLRCPTLCLLLCLQLLSCLLLIAAGSLLESIGSACVCRLQSAERASLRVALLSTLANCIYYNPTLALAAMQQQDQRMMPIFAAWSEVRWLLAA